MVGVVSSMAVGVLSAGVDASSMAALDDTDTALLIADCLLDDPLLDVATAATITINTTMDDTIPISLFLLNLHLMFWSRAAAADLSSSSISPRLIARLLFPRGDRKRRRRGVLSELDVDV